LNATPRLRSLVGHRRALPSPARPLGDSARQHAGFASRRSFNPTADHATEGITTR